MIRNLNILKWTASVALIALLVVNFHDRVVSRAFAGGLMAVPQDLHGWAWSDMPNGSDQNITPSNHQGGRGLGWISMNGTDTGTNGNGYYKVDLDPAVGTLSGDAWSEYGGWLDFTPSGPYPTFTILGGPNVLPTTPAKVDSVCLTSKGRACVVTGWARFIAGEDTNTQNTGGWDGWVNMSGNTYQGHVANGSFGVTYDADPTDVCPTVPTSAPCYGKFSGYAWGGEVAGWIGFDGVSITPPAPLTPGSCTDTNATNYGKPSPCTCAGEGQYAGTNFSYNYPFASGATYPAQCSGNTPPPPPGGNTASAQLNSSGCSNGNTTLSWTSTGTSMCSASYSGSAIFTGSQPINGSATITGIPQNGLTNNVTLTCTAVTGYTPATVTSTTSVMCPVICSNPNGCGGTGTQTPTVPKPIYKEN